jgi:hypothetical protein
MGVITNGMHDMVASLRSISKQATCHLSSSIACFVDLNTPREITDVRLFPQPTATGVETCNTAAQLEFDRPVSDKQTLTAQPKQF